MAAARELPEKGGYRIFMDNLFTSANLLRDIRALGHSACGTCRAGRGLPEEIEILKKKPTKANLEAAGLCQQGDWTFSMCQEENLLGVAWWDSGTGLFMSNCHNPVEKAVKRRKRGVRGQIDVPAPECAEEYNMWMGAIDDIDRVLALCSTRLRSFKWYLAIFFFLLDSMLNNAFCLFSKHNADTPLGSWTRRHFYKVLCEELLAEGGIDIENTSSAVEKVTPSFSDPHDMLMRPRIARLLSPGTPQYNERLFGGRHYIGCTGGWDKRKCCCLCSRAGAGRRGELKVSHYCQQCGVFLHVECFEVWHEQAEPQSPKFEVLVGSK